MASAQTYEQMRLAARDIFAHALKEASIEKAFLRSVGCSRGVLQVREDLFQLDSYAKTGVIAFGKAAHTMAAQMVEQIGTPGVGIIAAPHDGPQLTGFRYFHGGHPAPNGESLKAAEAILKTLASLPPKSLVIYLISGGGSSIVEKPLDDEISLNDLIATYKVLVHSGAPIAKINAIRKHLSAVKGGRMAAAAAKSGAQQVSILVSDVPEGKLDSLASGPTMPDNSTEEDCYAIAERYGMIAQFPASVRELFERKALTETPDKDDPLFHYARWWPILSNETAVRAAAAKAAEQGFAVEIDNSTDDWDYRKAADHLLDRLAQLRKGVSKACIVSGGEVTVKVEGEAGTGGRNQQFALYCADRIASENITVLSAGTDGIDGNSQAAGAVADGSTLNRYSLLGGGKPVSSALKSFDATPVFHSLGDDVVTGPTGNNVRDLRILLAY